MSEKKSDELSKKAKSALAGFGARAGRAQQSVRIPGSEIDLVFPRGYERQRARKLFKTSNAGTNAVAIFHKAAAGSENTVQVFWLRQRDPSEPGDVQGLVDRLHGTMTGSQGLIEVKSGTAAGGQTYLYSLIKTLSYDQPAAGVCYTLDLTLFSDAGNVRVTGEFQETGVAGMRDTQGMELAIRAGFAQVNNQGIQNWAADPYDPDYRKGVLRNLSEMEGLDVLFPEHPLSQARELLLAVLEHKVVREDEEKPGEDALASLFADRCTRSTVPAEPDREEPAPEKAPEPPAIKAIATRNAIKVIYYMMAADGEIFHSEEEKFDAIGAELDPDFTAHKAGIVAECKAQMEKIIDPEDRYDVLQDGVELALSPSVQTAEAFITPKLLAWDLLTLAYSDESYDESERRLLKTIVRRLNIDKAVFLEMESSILTLVDIERELGWIKTTDRPYLTIEAMVNELADRKNVIFDSVKDLIAL